MQIKEASWSRVFNLVRAVDGDHYITWHGARHYLDHVAFEKAGVAVRYMDFWPLPSGDFTFYVSGLDLGVSLDAETARTTLQLACRQRQRCLILGPSSLWFLLRFRFYGPPLTAHRNNSS